MKKLILTFLASILLLNLSYAENPNSQCAKIPKVITIGIKGKNQGKTPQGNIICTAAEQICFTITVVVDDGNVLAAPTAVQLTDPETNNQIDIKNLTCKTYEDGFIGVFNYETGDWDGGYLALDWETSIIVP